MGLGKKIHSKRKARKDLKKWGETAAKIKNPLFEKNVIYDYGELPTAVYTVEGGAQQHDGDDKKKKKEESSALSKSKKHMKRAVNKKLGFMDRAKAYYAAAFEADQAKYETHK